MPSPEQQREYTRLSSQLQRIGLRHMKELPAGAISLSLTITDGKVAVDVYDRMGKKIGTVPNETSSSTLRSELESAFERATLPDDSIIAPLAL
jgi:hypothetical protein